MEMSLVSFVVGNAGMKRLIVGIDPGVTCGVAALTLDGVPVFVGSQCGWTLNNLLKMLTNLGEPIIISSDVVPASELVWKISKNLNAITFTPLISLGAVEKQHLARDYAERYAVKLSNTHEMDALAAALKAYNHFKNKFEQIEMQVKESDSKVSIDDVKVLVIKGYTINRAISYLTTKPEETGIPLIPRKIPREERLKNLVDELNERIILDKEEIKRLRTENKELRKQIRSLEKEVSHLQQKIEEIGNEQLVQIRREREYHRLLDETNVLKRRLSESLAKLEEYKQRFDALQRLRELQSKGELTPLKPIENFTKDGLEKALRLYNVKPGDYILLMDAGGGGPTTAKTLAKKGVKAIVSQTPMSHQAREEFDKYDIPVIPAMGVKIEWIEGLPYVHMPSLKDALDRLKEIEIDELLANVEDMIEEHRREMKNKASIDDYPSSKAES